MNVKAIQKGPLIHVGSDFRGVLVSSHTVLEEIGIPRVGGGANHDGVKGGHVRKTCHGSMETEEQQVLSVSSSSNKRPLDNLTSS